MGIDKETIDIWKFGRPRPDLSMDETLAAPMSILTVEEQTERQDLIREHHKDFFAGAEAMARAFTARPGSS